MLTLIALYPALVSGQEAVSSIAEIMQADDIERDKKKIFIENIEGCIHFDNVSYHYPNSDKLVVSNFNLKENELRLLALRARGRVR